MPGFMHIIGRGLAEHSDDLILPRRACTEEIGLTLGPVGGIRDDMESAERDIPVRRPNSAMPDAHTQPDDTGDQQRQAQHN